MRRHSIAVAAVLTMIAGGPLAVPAVASSSGGHRHGTARSRHKPRTFSFYARVLRASRKGLELRTRKGKTVFFSNRQLKAVKLANPTHRPGRGAGHGRRPAAQDAATPPITVNILGLQPGVTVLVTETVNPDGSITITLTLPSTTSGGQSSVTGTVADVNNDSFDVQTPDGSDFLLHMDATSLSNLNLQPCDEVDVSYHQDSNLLIADTVTVTGSSNSSDCASGDDVTGNITSVSSTGITIQTDQGSQSFDVQDPSITDGFQVGDNVDVTYTTNADGSLEATDVEYVDQDASGPVTSVTSTSLTITDSATGDSKTFVGEPDAGARCTLSFDGIEPGDQVDVSYYVNGNQLVADSVGDGGWVWAQTC